MLRILYLCSTLANQGPTIHLRTLLPKLDSEAFAPEVLTLSPEPADSLLQSFRELGVPCYSLGLSRVAGAIMGVPRMRQFLRAHPADIIHSSCLRADVLSALAVSGIPRITTLHASFKCRTEMHGFVLGHTIRAIHFWGLRKLECVVCCSEDVRRETQPNLQTHAHAIQNGIDPDKYSPASSAERTLLRRRLGLPHDSQIFISIGYLSRRKDPITVIKGFLSSSAAKRGQLVFLGDGPLRGKCEQFAGCHSNVKLIGFVDNVSEYLRAADILISGSLAEGLPLAVIEGMACGLPVVVSDIGSHQEILAFNLMAGKLFPVKDVPALARTLEEVMNTDYESMRKAALGIVHNHLNARRMSTQYEQLYRELHEAYAKVQRA